MIQDFRGSYNRGICPRSQPLLQGKGFLVMKNIGTSVYYN
jgi:hypothetical protein